MQTSNPVLGKNTFTQFGFMGRADPAERMTVQGTVNKSLCLVGLATVSGAFSWAVIASSPGIGMALIVVAALAAFVLAMVASFRPQNAPIVAPIYALAEGVVLGGISLMYATASKGIVPLAIGLTLSVLLVMLVLYRVGVLRATPAFTRMVLVATGGVVLLYLVAMGLSFFGLSVPGLWTPTPLGIGIQLVIVGIAALNFIIDFDVIEQGALQGAPKFMEWYGAFSICVTLFWLYLEILRLLMQLNSRR